MKILTPILFLITAYVLMYLSVIAYYKINNYRVPFRNWVGGWKENVKFKEKLIVSFILQIPLFIFLFYTNFVLNN